MYVSIGCACQKIYVLFYNALEYIYVVLRLLGFEINNY